MDLSTASYYMKLADYNNHNNTFKTTALLTGLNTVSGAIGGAAMGGLLGHGAPGSMARKALLGAGIGAAESGIEGLIEGPVMARMQRQKDPNK